MKTTAQTKQLAGRITQLAMQLSEDTDHDVFVDYSPHVNWLVVLVYLGGWERDTQSDLEVNVDLDSSDACDQLELAALNIIEACK